jgi:hypothetical protein
MAASIAREFCLHSQRCNVHHRRLIVSLTGKCPEINHNIGIIHYSFILQHDQERKRWQSQWTRQWVWWTRSWKRQDRTTLVAGQCQRVVSVLHLVTMCLTMDTGQLQIRCELHGRNLYNLWVQTMHRTSAMSYRITSLWHSPNQSILQKSWQDMPFKNRWLLCTGQENIQQACLSKRVILEAAAALGVDPDAPSCATCNFWQKLHSRAYTCAMVCSFVSFTYYLSYLRRWIATKIRLWRCLLHCSFPSHSW